MKNNGKVAHSRITQRAKTVEKGVLEKTVMYWLFIAASCFLVISACSSVQSTVQGIVTGEAPADETYAGRQHFPVTPGEAVDCLLDVAPRHGWKVVSTGDEYDVYGQRGKFFRIETDQLLGGKKTVSGIFYAEKTGAYVRVSENNGLPETLVEPLIAEVREKKGYQ
ncbi:MAG: hypothetical protein AB7P69_14595 [Candidatus Binatia bacterium]